MTLYQSLQQARSEEDVKDAYIKALGLKGYSKNLIDIQTKEIWFEAKELGFLNIVQVNKKKQNFIKSNVFEKVLAKYKI